MMTFINHSLISKCPLSLQCAHIAAHFWLGKSGWITGSWVPNSRWNQSGFRHPIPFVFPPGKQNFYPSRQISNAEGFLTDFELVLCSQLSQWFLNFDFFIPLQSVLWEEKLWQQERDSIRPSDHWQVGDESSFSCRTIPKIVGFHFEWSEAVPPWLSLDICH